MILPDTSIWIEFFRQNAPYTGLLGAFLKNQQVITIEPVFAELLYGTRSDRDRRIIQSFLEILPRLEFKTDSLINAADYANRMNYHNLGIGLTDSAILSPIIAEGHKFWTLDKRILENIAAENLYYPD